MAEFVAPGVYVEEVSFRPRAVEGVPTGVAGFVRASTAAQPAGLFTSAADFERDNLPWEAVRSFFAEGGKRLFVRHAASADPADVAAPLTALDEADVIAAPGLTGPGVAAALIAHAEATRQFALIDPPGGLDLGGVRAFRDGLESSRAALYWPWIVTGTGPEPPSPSIAGVIARLDMGRGIWNAPANEVIVGATGFERNVPKVEQDVCNPLGINCLRSFPGRGHRVWGARTLSSDPDWKYIAVRRQIDWIERSLEAGLAWTAFEPNGEPLWAHVRQATGDFLYTHWRAGGMPGATPEQAYFVRCDRTTMTQNDLDEGRLIVQFGVAVVKPAEFVVIRSSLFTLHNRTTGGG